MTYERPYDIAEANMIYQEDLGALTPTRIMQFISHHNAQQVPRLDMLDQYYQGFNKDILAPQNRRTDANKADYRATHPYGKYIADFQTAFSVGNPIGMQLDDKTHERFDAVNDANDVDTENYDLFLDCSRFGRAYELIYRGTDNIEHFVLLDPKETFVIYSTDVTATPLMAVRYHQIPVVGDNDQTTKVQYVVETWTGKLHVQYQPVEMDGALIEADNEPISTFPVIEYHNNRFRLGDYENVIPLIDLYDAAQSDTANYMSDLNDAMLVLQGDINALFQGTDLLQDVQAGDDQADVLKKVAEAKAQVLKEMKDANLLLLQTGVNAQGNQTSVSAGYIHKEYDVTGTEAYKKRLAWDIHKFSHTPDLTDENFAGNASGVAMQYKVLGTIELASIKRRMFEQGLYARYLAVQASEQAASDGWDIDANQIKFTFKDNIPQDDVSIISAIVSAGATLPQRYLYRYLPGVTDPDEIADMLADQQKESDYQLARERSETNGSGATTPVAGQAGTGGQEESGDDQQTGSNGKG